MIYKILADALIIVHFTFILFVCLGGLLLFKSKKIAWLHIPAAFWGAVIEFTGWICPLTPLENQLRFKAEIEVYSGGFIEHYLIPIIYPEGLTRPIQWILGSAVILLNLMFYLKAFWRRK